MSHRLRLSHALAAAAGLVAMVPVSSAYAGDGGGWRNGSWYGDDAPPPPSTRVEPRTTPLQAPEPLPREPQFNGANYRQAPRFAAPGREAWLADCRARVASRDNGAGGAVIGGVVGGVAGNRIAGRGNRTIGTLGGAAVGAVAGAAIDRAEDRGRAADECEAYLDDYYARYAAGAYGAPTIQPGYSQGYAQPGYAMSYNGYGYTGSACCGAPVMVPVQPAPECTETIEYIYEDVPAPRRAYHRPAPRRTKIVRDKRIKIVPDKRVGIN